MITDHRTSTKARRAPTDATDEQRFGFEDLVEKPAPRTAASERWQFRTPDGWSLLPPTQFRDHGWRIGDLADGSLTFLDGDAGGLAANVNRWRTQMSKPALGDADVESLAKRPWLGTDALVVEIDGTYRPSGGAAPVAEARLLGLVARLSRGTAFLKLVGRAGAVEAERDRFFALADSIRLASGDDVHGERVADSTDAPAHATSASPSLDAPTPPDSPRPRLQFTAPQGWVRQPDQPMREASFAPSSAPDVLIRVSILRGRAGGLRANVDRWREELGRPPITDEEFAALARGPVLGGEGVYVEIEGASGDAATALTGMVREREDASIYAKMTGPVAGVRAERERFRAFCESIRE